MDFRQIFFFFFFFFSNQKLGRTQGKKKPQRFVIHDKVVKKCLISRKEACQRGCRDFIFYFFHDTFLKRFYSFIFREGKGGRKRGRGTSV